MADTVAAQGDAHALALAALLRSGALSGAEPRGADGSPARPRKMDDTVRDWLDRAQRQAPDDVVALVVAINLERFDEGRRQTLIARWRALEPDNLVPILLAPPPEADMFDAAARAKVFDSHYDDFLRAMVQTLSRAIPVAQLRAWARQAGAEPREFLAGVVIGYWAAIVMPQFQQVVGSCRPEGLAEPRRQQCRAVAGVLLRRSDMLIAQMIGAPVAARLAVDAGERRDAETCGRDARWLSERSMLVSMQDEHGFMQRYAQLIEDDQPLTEQSVMRQLIVEAGYPPVPPPGWQPGQQP